MERTIFPKMQHPRAIDSGPPGSMDRGFADQKTPVLCPHPEQPHQLTDIQPPSTAGLLNLSLWEAVKSLPVTPVKNAIKTRQWPKLDKPSRLPVKALKHEPKDRTSLPGSASKDLNSFKVPPLQRPLHPPENLIPFLWFFPHLPPKNHSLVLALGIHLSSTNLFHFLI